MTQIRLDYDGRLPSQLLDRIQRIGRLCRWRVEAVSFARGPRRGWHVSVLCRKRMSPFAVVAAQVLLGSDVERETFNYMRASVLHVAPEFWRKPSRWNPHYSRKL